MHMKYIEGLEQAPAVPDDITIQIVYFQRITPVPGYLAGIYDKIYF